MEHAKRTSCVIVRGMLKWLAQSRVFNRIDVALGVLRSDTLVRTICRREGIFTSVVAMQHRAHTQEILQWSMEQGLCNVSDVFDFEDKDLYRVIRQAVDNVVRRESERCAARGFACINAMHMQHHSVHTAGHGPIKCKTAAERT